MAGVPDQGKDYIGRFAICCEEFGNWTLFFLSCGSVKAQIAVWIVGDTE